MSVERFLNSFGIRLTGKEKYRDENFTFEEILSPPNDGEVPRELVC